MVGKIALSTCISSLVAACGAGVASACNAGTGVNTAVNMSVNSGTGSMISTVQNDSISETTMSGGYALAIVNGDRVQLNAGKVTVNGVSYGDVGKESVVRYLVKGKDKKLFVDGVERKPAP